MLTFITVEMLTSSCCSRKVSVSLHQKVWQLSFQLFLVLTYTFFTVLGLSDFLFWSRGYKTFFMLNSNEHEIYPAHKC